MKKKNKLYKKLIILCVALYAIFTLTSQQKTLNQYTENTEELKVKIAEQESYKQDLENEKENVNSLEFIEQMAREKLDMYYPNERVYTDKGM